MTDTSLTAPPVLSTPDSHILSEIEPVTSSLSSSPSTLSEEQFKLRYEIERTIQEIRQHKWRRVGLQFPDSMLMHSTRVCQLLARGLSETTSSPCEAPATPIDQADRVASQSLEQESVPVKLTILADTSYGSCCVDEIAAEHVDAEAVVHYGHACLSPTARLPVLHVFTENSLDYEGAVNAFVNVFPSRDTKIILTGNLLYASHVSPLKRRLDDLGYQNIFAAEIVHDPSSIIPNRSMPDALREDPNGLNDWQLYHIAEPPTALLLTLSSQIRGIHIYTPEIVAMGDESRAQEANTAMVLRRRYALVTSMNTVSTWGILINTLSVKNYLHLVDHVKKQIAASGKKSYLFVVGKLNAAKVANFSEIGGWVVIGCWESSLIDSRDFFKPIITPFELDLALASDEERVWTGAWRSDFDGVLEHAALRSSKPGLSEQDLDGGQQEAEAGDMQEVGSEEESAPPEFDLRTGRYVSHTRPMSRRNIGEHHVGSNAATASKALAKHRNRDIVAVRGVASTGAEFLAQKRTWRGLGSDLEIKYEDEEEEGGLIERGRSGIARGYTVGESAAT